LGRHYSLPIWSFRDIYWLPFALSHADQSRFIAELRPSSDHPVVEPSHRALYANSMIPNQLQVWYIHQFFADVMAGIAQREFDRYFAMQAASSASASSKEPAPVYAMPLPIVKLSNFNLCDENAAAVLNLVSL